MADLTITPLQQFYKDKSIFVTGATGFIGKVLIEKLLRSCGELQNIYILLRRKDGKTPEMRLRELIDSPVFKFTDEELAFNKIIAVDGDISSPGLGLCDEDREKLTANVSIVFHSAASVKFHGPLKDFIAQNVYGTKSVVGLCKEMKQLESVVYVSTAYANCGLQEIEEKVYPLSKSAKELISEINAIENLSVEKLTTEILEGRPNSYTFSKALAENLVEEIKENLPIVIVRPSIVTPSLQEPTPGIVETSDRAMTCYEFIKF